jgi:diadenylate cyclase
MCGELCWLFERYFSATALVDVLMIAGAIFSISLMLRSTQSLPLLRGLIILLLVVGAAAAFLPLPGFRWLLSNSIGVAAIALPVIFQPEIRRALERLGRVNMAPKTERGALPAIAGSARSQVISGICAAAARLSERRHGALIVIERQTNLQQYIDSGIALDSEVSPQLLLTVFYPKTELHDGAVILRNGKIAAAAAVLPLSANRELSERKLGTRHRAAIGITEIGDPICVVVSEETGQIAVANNGRLIRKLDAGRLETILVAFYGETSSGNVPLWQRVRRVFNPRALPEREADPDTVADKRPLPETVDAVE